MTRSEKLNRLRNMHEIPVIVVGAGINGVGVYRELALQGIPTLLIDKADISAGASSASSRMIHGGLRYLENNEVKLVKESLSERNRLLLNAPHYVMPLSTTIPIFNWFTGILNAIPKFFGRKVKNISRGAIIVKIGLVMYDLFTKNERILPKHKFTSRKKSLKDRPYLHPDIVCTATYFDAWISHPERLCLELVKDSDVSNTNCIALNYVSLIGQMGANKLILRDEITLEVYEIGPKIVINATGAWIDFTNKAIGKKTQMIGGTKGSHLVIDNPELMKATKGEMLFYENNDGRICILFPFQGKVLVGSTDIKIDNPEEAICMEEEKTYMLHAVKQIFPSIEINDSQIVFRYCGVRPLPNNNEEINAQISRDHEIKVIEPSEENSFPIYNLIGGKWTTFRSFSEQAADKVMAHLDFPRKLNTKNLQIGGGKNFPKNLVEKEQWILELQNKTGVSRERIKELFVRYGTCAGEFAEYLSKGEDSNLFNHRNYSSREIQYILKSEYAVHLDDVILRRTTMALNGELTRELINEIAIIMKDWFNWTEQKTGEEIERTFNILETKHNVKLKIK